MWWHSIVRHIFRDKHVNPMKLRSRIQCSLIPINYVWPVFCIHAPLWKQYIFTQQLSHTHILWIFSFSVFFFFNKIFLSHFMFLLWPVSNILHIVTSSHIDIRYIPVYSTGPINGVLCMTLHLATRPQCRHWFPGTPRNIHINHALNTSHKTSPHN